MNERRISPSRLLRAVVDAGILPLDATVVPRHPEVRWVERAMGFVAYVEPAKHGELGWVTHVCDPRYGAPRGEGGLGASVAIRQLGDDALLRPVPGAPPWPTGSRPDDAVLAYLRSTLGASRSFVRDRADLVWLMMQRQDVVRGELYAWLYQGYPARLIKALLIARDMGDPHREAEITAILHSDAPVPSYDTPEPMWKVARHWAKELAKDLGEPIEF